MFVCLFLFVFCFVFCFESSVAYSPGPGCRVYGDVCVCVGGGGGGYLVSRTVRSFQGVGSRCMCRLGKGWTKASG